MNPSFFFVFFVCLLVSHCLAQVGLSSQFYCLSLPSLELESMNITLAHNTSLVYFFGWSDYFSIYPFPHFFSPYTSHDNTLKAIVRFSFRESMWLPLFHCLMLTFFHSFCTRSCTKFVKGAFDLPLSRTPLLSVSSILNSHLPLFSSHSFLFLPHWFLSLLNCSHNAVYNHTYGINLKRNHLFIPAYLYLLPLKLLQWKKNQTFCSNCFCFVISHFLIRLLPPHQAVSSNPLRPCLTAWPMWYSLWLFTSLQH